MNDLEKVLIAIDYIETHLMEKLDLDKIAQATHYSKFHLHRSFTKTVGVTIYEYSRRRQLSEAAKLLVFSNKSIVDIALLSGYSSQQAFATMFKAMYKQSPNQFRENNVYYPLQLKYELEGYKSAIHFGDTGSASSITFATEKDIPSWMELTRLVIDGFPYLNEEEYLITLKRCIKQKEALILKEEDIAIGTMLFSSKSGSIEFLGVHPLYRSKGITELFLDKVWNEFFKDKEVISITTYRDGDKADTGYREELKELGFAEAELLTEFGYPTQKFIMKKK